MEEILEPAIAPTPTKVKSKNYWSVIILVSAALTIGTLVVAPFFITTKGGNWRLRLLGTHDMPTLVAIMEQFDKGLRSGALYPRWLPDTNYGYGVAMMVFYPPGLFYLASLLYTFIQDWTATIFVICALGLAASGLAMYMLSRAFFSKTASILAALVYMLLPYHLLDLYWRGAIPEFLGFVFIPLVIYFFYRVGNQGRWSHYAGLGLFYGLHIMTHLPVSYLFTYALAFYALIWTVQSRDVRVLFRLACGMALGLLVSAVYWLPAALESQYVYEPTSELFPYHNSYIHFYRGRSDFDHFVVDTFTIQGVALLVTILILAFTARVSRNAPAESRPSPGHSQVLLWSVMAVVTTLMSTFISKPVSMLIPKIQMSVPAWRWLAVASAFMALLVAATVERLGKKQEFAAVKLWSFRAALFLVLATNLWLAARIVMVPAQAGHEAIKSAEFATDGFIPKDAWSPFALVQTEFSKDQVIVTPNGFGEIIKWEPQYREIEVTTQVDGVLRLRTYQFPGWQAKLNGQTVPVQKDTKGAQIIRIPAGKHTVEVFFVNTLPRNLGAALFVLSLLIIAGLCLVDIRKRKQPEAAGNLPAH